MHRAGWRYVSVLDFAQEKARLRNPIPEVGDRFQGCPTGASVAHSPQTINNYNYYGHHQMRYNQPANPLSPSGVQALANGSPSAGGEVCSRTAPQAWEVSPAPRPYPPFHDFLDFSGVTSNFSKARRVLEEQGINEFGRLLDREIYSLSNLTSVGLPFAQAADIYKAVPLYNQHLKDTQ